MQVVRLHVLINSFKYFPEMDVDKAAHKLFARDPYAAMVMLRAGYISNFEKLEEALFLAPRKFTEL